MKEVLIKINKQDNVAVLLAPVKKGSSFSVDGTTITVQNDLPKGHKIALRDIQKGENIIKYAFPIGHATCGIPTGSHVHTHNLKSNLEGKLDYTYNPSVLSANSPRKPLEKLSALPSENPSETATANSLETATLNPLVTAKVNPLGTSVETGHQATFLGYKRENGSVGIRNEIWIINTVGCVNKTAERLAFEANKLYDGRVDGVYPFAHPYGCSQLGEDHETTRKVLAGLVNHPNAAGVLVLGLGCENNTIDSFRELLSPVNEKRVKFLVAQEVNDELEAGLSLIGELVEYSQGMKRQPCPVSSLVVGLKCGGSDAISGITANPLVGSLSDMLISYGGSSVLTEVPEMFGAETILMNRCVNENVFDDTVNLINNFKEYYIRHNQVVYENPSPGNKEGGITTLEEKSLGCTYKGGTGPVVSVLNIGEPVVEKGLNLLNGPGNDIVAVTNLAASGVHIILFTTGRGTPLGAPVPTMKIASNSDLANRKQNWIDFNAGRLLEGRSMNELTRDLFELVLKMASGEVNTKNEINGYREIAIFKDGVTL